VIFTFQWCLFDHNVAAKDRFVAICSTNVETNNPEKELEFGLALLGPIEEKFISVSDLYEPNSDGTKDKCFISKSYDSTSHFETTSSDVLDIYKRITGKEVDLTPKARPEEES